MADHRRDQTYQIPASTLAELQASRKKLAPRQDTLEYEQRPTPTSDAPAAGAPPESATLHHPPRGKVAPEEVEAQLGLHLDPFAPALRASFCRAFGARAYGRASSLLEDDAKRQPKNLSLAKEARILRAHILSTLEWELGGLAVKPRKAKPLSTVEAPAELSSMLRRIDGNAPVERIVRESEADRVRALDFLLDLARSGFLDLVIEDGQVPEKPSLPPVSGSGTRPKTEPPPAEMANPGEQLIVDASPPPSVRPSSSAGPALPPEPEPEPWPVPAPVSVREPARVRGSSRTTSREVPAFVPVAVGAVLVLGIALTVLFFLRKPDGSGTASAPLTPSPPVAQTTQPVTAKPAETAKPETTAAPALETIQVKIEVEPKYARVTLDGVLLTGQPIEVKLQKDAKEHVIQVESAGYRTHTAKFVADANASFAVSLQRLPPKH